MSQHEPRTSVERVEAQLRAEAMVQRRPTPPGLHAAVMARIQGDPLPVPSTAPRALSPGRRRAFALGGLAAAAVVLLLLRGLGPATAGLDAGSPGANGTIGSIASGEPGPMRRIASLLEASRAAHATAFEGAELERPLLAELEALGQDTAHAAATLARGLPGPVGRLFGGG